MEVETGKGREEGYKEWYSFGLSYLKGQKWRETFISHCPPPFFFFTIFPQGVILPRVEGKYLWLSQSLGSFVTVAAHKDGQTVIVTLFRGCFVIGTLCGQPELSVPWHHSLKMRAASDLSLFRCLPAAVYLLGSCLVSPWHLWESHVPQLHQDPHHPSCMSSH